jgi:hypothetical protein
MTALNLHQHRQRDRRRRGLCHEEAANAWFAEHDPKGVAFEYPVVD